MARRVAIVCLSAVTLAAVWPAMSRAADSAAAVHGVVDRVELAAVRDDPGACSVMGAPAQMSYIRGAEVFSEVRKPVTTCAAAVRADHAGYLRNHELFAQRTAQHAVARAFAAGTVTYATGDRATAVAHLTTRQFLGQTHTTITARLLHLASGWRVVSVRESPSSAISPPPPLG